MIYMTLLVYSYNVFVHNLSIFFPQDLIRNEEEEIFLKWTPLSTVHNSNFKFEILSSIVFFNVLFQSI